MFFGITNKQISFHKHKIYDAIYSIHISENQKKRNFWQLLMRLLNDRFKEAVHDLRRFIQL